MYAPQRTVTHERRSATPSPRTLSNQLRAGPHPTAHTTTRTLRPVVDHAALARPFGNHAVTWLLHDSRSGHMPPMILRATGGVDHQRRTVGCVQRQVDSGVSQILGQPNDHFTALRQYFEQLPVNQRRRFLTSEGTDTRKTINDKIANSGWRLTLFATLMVGSFTWKNPKEQKEQEEAPSGNAPGDKFSSFYKFTQSPPLQGFINPETGAMNCWESIQYAAYLAGLVDTPGCFFEDSTSDDEGSTAESSGDFNSPEEETGSPATSVESNLVARPSKRSCVPVPERPAGLSEITEAPQPSSEIPCPRSPSSPRSTESGPDSVEGFINTGYDETKPLLSAQELRQWAATMIPGTSIFFLEKAPVHVALYLGEWKIMSLWGKERSVESLSINHALLDNYSYRIGNARFLPKESCAPAAPMP
ncbi:MAG: hypothetical protein JXA67_20850 [Micromonosporaceae bacterium]|nr:hypothetical protein [Micromonosporaceae bacterium]